jgi:hypothetical protein
MRTDKKALKSERCMAMGGSILSVGEALSSFSKAYYLPNRKTAKLRLFGKACVFDTCYEFEASPFRIFFHLCTRTIKRVLMTSI